jgi:uncharacterized membrane protein YeaQ/YmgE (transglycosylase-associated protein family)
MGLLGWILLGFVAGFFARAITGFERSGCIFTIVIGIIGAVVGGALFNAATGKHTVTRFTLSSMFVAFIGATLLLLVLQVLSRRPPPPRPRRRY